jgi:hypothetical protein
MSRSRMRVFLLFFTPFSLLIFVDLHFLAFYPLTIRDPVPVGRAVIIALVGGSCAGLYAATRNSK